MKCSSWGLLAGLGLLAGCGSPLVARPVTLAQLADHTLQVTLTDVDSLERDSSLGAYRVTVVFAGSACVQLTGDVTATLNGEPMQLLPGGVPDTGVGGREVCDPPRATFDFDPAQWKGDPQDITIQFQDGASSVRLVLHDAKTKRSFGFMTVGGTEGTLRRGQEQTYVWNPPSDPVSGSIQIGLVHKATNVSVELPVEAPGPTARFLVPAGMVEGAYYLILSGTADAQVSACEGVAGCSGGVFHSEEFDVTVTP